MAATPRRLARAEIFMMMMDNKRGRERESRLRGSRCVGCTQVKIMSIKTGGVAENDIKEMAGKIGY